MFLGQFRLASYLQIPCNIRSPHTLSNLHIHFKIRSAYLFAHVQKNLPIFIFYLDFRVNTYYVSIAFSLEASCLNGLLSLKLAFAKWWFVKIYCALCLLFRFLQNFNFLHAGANGLRYIFSTKLRWYWTLDWVNFVSNH